MVKPLLNIHIKASEPYCEYPTEISIPMKDGTIHDYVLKNKTTYQFENVMKCLKRMKVGYQYGYPQKRRNRFRHGK